MNAFELGFKVGLKAGCESMQKQAQSANPFSRDFWTKGNPLSQAAKSTINPPTPTSAPEPTPQNTVPSQPWPGRIYNPFNKSFWTPGGKQNPFYMEYQNAKDDYARFNARYPQSQKEK